MFAGAPLSWAASTGRRSLEDFLAAAAGLFSRKGVELHVVGSADESYLAGLRAIYPAVTFTGAIEDVYLPLSEARVALVPDYLGGSKLKSLDYVFSRVQACSTVQLVVAFRSHAGRVEAPDQRSQ